MSPVGSMRCQAERLHGLRWVRRKIGFSSKPQLDTIHPLHPTFHLMKTLTQIVLVMAICTPATAAKQPAVTVAPAQTTTQIQAWPMAWGTPWDFLSERRLTSKEVANLSEREIWIWKNALYARKGYIFKNPVLLKFFLKYDWYVPRHKSIPKSAFSSIEAFNVSLLHQFEQ